MIVLDASAGIEWLLQTQKGLEIGKRVGRRNETLHAPHLIDLEVAQVLRRLVLTSGLHEDRAQRALGILIALPMLRHAHYPLMERIWNLKNNLNAYDAAYIALAEALNAPLVTTDRKLKTAPGHNARVELM
jgi:predicted nucleic acid-binding protein